MGALSKGCGICKRRKVKCDETRPNCTRCSSAGIECTGFAQRLRFVDEKHKIQRRAAVLRAQFHEFSTHSSNVHLKSQLSKGRPSQPLRAPLSLAKELPLTAFKDDIFISHLVYRFFEGKHRHLMNAAAKSPCGLPIEWIAELVNTPQKPRLKSWDALAAVVYGQANKNYDIITSAVRIYGQALSELRFQLSDPHNRYVDSTLASITALYTYQARSIH